MPTALIFGGSGAIGSAIVKTFAKYGYTVAFTYCKNQKKATKLAEKITKISTTPPIVLRCDCNVESDILAVFGQPIYFDVVVNCVGNALYKELAQSSWQDFNDIVASNLRSAVFITKFAAEKMQKREIAGAIIHLSSIWGNVGASCESLYAATKGAINAFTKSVAKELAPAKIRVNAIACGMIQSEMNAHFSMAEIEEFFQFAPISAMGVPEDIAETALFLAQHRYITGEILTVDGGVTLQ